MDRAPLLALLDEHIERVPEDHVRADHVRQFVRHHDDAFLRSNLEGHVTASAWIIDPTRERFLLTHHKKLDRWLQLGGHADGETDVRRAALSEAREESGIEGFSFVATAGRVLPLDVDVHAIPARKDEPRHLHHDIRFLLVADTDRVQVAEDESHGLRWFPHAELEAVTDEESMLRLGRRTIELLKGPLDLVPARDLLP